MKRPRYRTLLVAALALCVTSCTTWSAPRTELPPPRRGSTLPDALVVLHDGRVLRIKDAWVRGDSILGFADSRNRQPVQVAKSDVEELQIVEFSPRRTFTFIGMMLGVLGYQVLRNPGYGN